MSDNVAITAGSGTTVATDDVGGVQYQRVKVSHGADGSATDSSTAAPFPVTLQYTGANATPLAVSVSSAAVTQSGTWTVRAVGNGGASLDSTVGAGAAPTNALAVGGLYNSTEITATNGQAAAIQLDSKGRQRMVLMDAAGNTRGANIDASNRLSVTLDNVAASNISTNVAQFNGVTPLMGAGNTGTGAQRVTISTDDLAHAAWGQAVAGAVAPTGAQYHGGLAATALPTAEAAGDLVGVMVDKFGRQVNLVGTIRDLRGTQTTTISASTSETTIVTAAASVFNDIEMIVVSNTSASTNTRIDFRDDTAGTILFSLQSNGGQPPVGFSGVSLPQTAVNKNWTAQCATSTTDIRIYVVFAKNR